MKTNPTQCFTKKNEFGFALFGGRDGAAAVCKDGHCGTAEKSGRARLRRIRAGRAPYSCPCGAARNGADKALYRRKQFRKRKCIKQCIQMYNMHFIHSKMHTFED